MKVHLIQIVWHRDKDAPFNAPIMSLHCHPSRNLLATAGQDKTVKVRPAVLPRVACVHVCACARVHGCCCVKRCCTRTIVRGKTVPVVVCAVCPLDCAGLAAGQGERQVGRASSLRARLPRALRELRPVVAVRHAAGILRRR